MSEEKQLARWIYWEDNYYYCYDCVQKRLAEINQNKEFSESIDYESGDTCGYYEDYADEDHEVECCKCHTPLYSNVDYSDDFL